MFVSWKLSLDFTQKNPQKDGVFSDVKNPSFEPSRSRLRLRMCDPAPFVEMRRVDIARPLPGEEFFFLEGKIRQIPMGGGFKYPPGN